LGAAAGGTIGYVAAGLTGAGIGLGAGALAGLGFGAAAYAAVAPRYWYPIPYPYYNGFMPPIYHAWPYFPGRIYYTPAW